MSGNDRHDQPKPEVSAPTSTPDIAPDPQATRSGRRQPGQRVGGEVQPVDSAGHSDDHPVGPAQSMR